jgi:hypothetical protein
MLGCKWQHVGSLMWMTWHKRPKSVTHDVHNLSAVRFGAWMKRTFSLKPALNRIREQRAFARSVENQTKQVEWMR